MLKFDLFKEWLPSILDGKVGYLYANVAENDVTAEDFMLLRALSQYQDCVGIANIANEKLHNKVASKLLYDFLFYGVPKKKRYSGKWGKQTKQIKELEVIQQAFQCNTKVAKEYMELIPKDELKALVKEYTDFGGNAK